MRALYRDKKLTLFSMHLYTARDFYKDFADSLSRTVILVDIYPARATASRRHQQTDFDHLRRSKKHVQERRNSRRTEQERYRSSNNALDLQAT